MYTKTMETTNKIIHLEKCENCLKLSKEKDIKLFLYDDLKLYLCKKCMSLTKLLTEIKEKTTL